MTPTVQVSWASKVARVAGRYFASVETRAARACVGVLETSESVALCVTVVQATLDRHRVERGPSPSQESFTVVLTCATHRGPARNTVLEEIDA